VSVNDNNKTGYIHSMYTGGMVDGPGIRTVIFFAGCNMRCKYCHNPDTWARSRGKIMSVQDLLDEVLKYRSYYRFSGGGVTISGGDPLMQPDFLAEVLAACRDKGIHTVIDTAGCAPEEQIRRILPHTNIMMLDFKAIDNDKHMYITAQPIAMPIRTLEISREMGVSVWIRFVLVPGLTDDIDEMREMARFFKDFPNIEKIEILPFHKSGEYKWKDLNIPYELHDTLPPTAEQLRVAHEIFGV